MGWRRIPVAVLALLFAIFAPSLAQAEKRVALVIGNSAYQFAPELKNPKNDADAIAKSLTAVSFEVVKGIDLDEAAMRAVINSFAEKLQTADVALLFYAGHGLQVDSSNYLLPINGQLRNKIDLQFQSIRLDFLLSLMESADRTSIVLLDACRDNPLAETLARSLGTRSGSVGRGLAKIETGVGTYIGFSTQPGNVALDGDGTNSPFATALLKNLEKEGLDIESMMRLVRADVMAATKNQQIPWGNSSLVGGGFFFKQAQDKPKPEPEAKAPEAASEKQLELAYWNAIKDGGSIAYFEAYLQQYPNGTFAGLARLRVGELKAVEERRIAEAKVAEKKAADEARKAEQEKLAASKVESERLAKEKVDAELKVKELAEAERKAKEEAKRAEQERNAALKAETERLASKNAEADRLAQEKADAALKAKEEQQKEIEIAKLEGPPAKTEPEAAIPSIDPNELARSVQTELARLGCLSAKADGKWGGSSEKALREYSGRQGIKLASLDPTEEVLNRLKATTVGVCPLVCGKGLEEKGGRCEKVKQEAKVEPKPESKTSEKSTIENNSKKPELRTPTGLLPVR